MRLAWAIAAQMRGHVRVQRLRALPRPAGNGQRSRTGPLGYEGHRHPHRVGADHVESCSEDGDADAATGRAVAEVCEISGGPRRETALLPASPERGWKVFKTSPALLVIR